MASFSVRLVIYHPKHVDENKLEENKLKRESFKHKWIITGTYYCFLGTVSNIFICNIIETLENTNRRKTSSTIHDLYVCKSYCFPRPVCIY